MALNILLVDDDTDFAELTAESLRDDGHRVSIAKDGASATVLAREIRPDVVLLDLQLPDADGYEIARTLRGMLPQTTPIIVVTGLRDANLVDEVDLMLQAIGTGDQPALRALYERSHRIVFTLVMRICAQREMAEEVTLDVFHDVWRRSKEYDAAAGTVVGWIMMQARSRALDRLRFEQRKKRVDPQPGRRDERPEADGPGAGIAAREHSSSLHAALTTLTVAERQAIETAFFSELTYSETATRLDEPVGTVKTRVRSALAKLRKALGTTGGRP